MSAAAKSERPGGLLSLPLRAWQGFWTWAVGLHGSTRSAALIRIALMACVWTRWGDRFGIFTDPSWPTLALSLGFYLGSFCAMIGLWTRPACAVTAAICVYCHYYLALSEQYLGWGNHHMRLLVISVVLLVFTPCGRSYSVDRWLAVRRARREGREPPAEAGNLWGLRVMALFLSSLYASTAYHKTNEYWLSGMRMEQIFSAHFLGHRYFIADWWTRLMQMLAVSTWTLEWFLPIGLWFRRTRTIALVSGVLMHSLFFAFFEVYTFSANMMVLYLAFIPPQTLHAWCERMLPARGPSTEPEPETPAQTRAAWPVWAGGALVLAFLAAVPLRQGFTRNAQLAADNKSEAEPEARDPIHPSSAPFVQLELRPLDAGPDAPPIDWDALFDAREREQDKRLRLPARQRLIGSEDRINSARRKVCAHVEPDVRLGQRARLATPTGWQELESPDTDVCHRRPKPSRSGGKTP